MYVCILHTGASLGLGMQNNSEFMEELSGKLHMYL